MRHTKNRLRFISFEKYPLGDDDWQRVCAGRRQHLPIYAELQQQPLPLLSGWHQRTLADGQIILTVYHGEVEEGLADLVERQKNSVDAWFLDGFAPAKNPAMWTPQLYQSMAGLSGLNTTVATFTAAGHVRRGLEAVGFAMRKVDQQPLKRESLAGHYTNTNPRYTQPTHVRVYGAGIAGASVARHLAEAGVSVSVYDPAGIASGASAIDATIVHARLLGDQSPDADLRCAAFHYGSNFLKRFSGWHPDGVMQLQGPNLDQQKLLRISRAYAAQSHEQTPWIQHLNARETSQIAGLPVDSDGLFFPSAGHVNTPVLCADLLAHPLISLFSHAGPVFEDVDADVGTPQVICAATATRQFAGCELLEITDVYGQLDHFNSSYKVANLPLVGNGYLVPTSAGCVLGASYEYSPWQPSKATAHNLNLNQHLLQVDQLQWSRRMRGARAIASDRNPIVGALDPPAAHAEDKAIHPVWLATAFGSMGTTAAPLSAAMLSAELLGWMPPVEQQVSALMRPQRFAQRQARRGIRHIEPFSGD